MWQLALRASSVLVPFCPTADSGGKPFNLLGRQLTRLLRHPGIPFVAPPGLRYFIYAKDARAPAGLLETFGEREG